MQDIRQRLLATFQVEQRDHVEQIRSLLALISAAGGPPADSQLEEVFRRAHTLKGAARVVELRSVEQLAHRMETLFARVRQGEMPLTPDAIVLVQRALDASEDSVADMGAGTATASITPALAAIDRLLGVESEAAPAEVLQTPEAPEPVPVFQPLETVRVNAQNFDGLLRSAVELLAESYRQGQVTTELKAMERQMASFGAKFDQLFKEDAPAEAVALQRESRAIARQLNAVTRLQRQGSWTMTRLGKQLQRDVWQARMVPAETLLEGYRKMMRDLARDEAKQIDFHAVSTGEHADRRVLDALKDPLMHVLRNAVSHGIEIPPQRIAKGKSASATVTLTITGDAQRLKITVEDDGRGMDLAKILETAVRRNLISEAEAANCSPHEATRLLFRPGFSTASSVTSLSGRGMGLSVVQEAVQALQGEVDIKPREGGGTSLRISVPVSISSHRLLLVNCGGHTFAIPLYWIERVQRLRLLDVQTVEGKPAMTLDGNTVPLFTLRHLLNIPAGADKLDRNTRSHPVVILRSSIEHAQDGHADAAGFREVPDPVGGTARAVCASKGQRSAIMVDSLLRETEAVIQDLGLDMGQHVLPGSPGQGKISGGILLEDGSAALVLNPAAMLEASAAAKQSDFSALSEPAKRAFSILVVDDSITTRTLEKSILEAHGYRVRIAVDGVEALAQLQNEKSDLVISDVQMPRLDGFGLLEAIKRDQDLKQIPVILVTSLERREDQERGLGLGADAYIVKRKFDQADLLAAIRQIL